MSTAVVRALATALAAAGARVDGVLAELGIDVATLSDPDARVPTERAFALFERAEELSGDPDFGLHTGARMPLGAVEVLDHATRTSRTIADAIQRMTRYYALLVERIEVRLDAIGDLARVTHCTEPPLVSPRHAVEMLFAVIVARGRELTGCEWPLRFVRFVHARPADTRELERFFRAPIEFGQPVDELLFERSFLDAPLSTADPALSKVLDRYADVLLARLPAADPFLTDVRGAVAETLRGGEPSLVATAHRLGTSGRTLQRRLAEADTTYAAVVDDVRRELATRYLAQPRTGIGEIAYLLGFSRASAFRRAFKRWTGKTPKEMREALGKRR